MNAGVANGARLILHRLVVRRPHRRIRRKVRRRRMALEADRVDVGAVQQPWIRSAVRGVACGTPFGLDDRVLIDKRPGRLGVTLGANRILLRRRPQAFLAERAMRVVAIGALHQSLFHLVMERHGELRLHVGMALEAEHRLSGFQQMLGGCARVNAVAANAADVAFAVGRALKVRVLALVATEARLVDFLCGAFGRVEDLGNVAAALDVRFTGTVAAFASHAGSAMHFSKLCMGIVGEPFRNFLMAGRAGVCAYKVARSSFCGRGSWFVVLRESRHCRRTKQCHAQQQHQTHAQPHMLPGSRIAQ